MFYSDLMKEPLEAVLAACPRPAAAQRLFGQMMRDVMDPGAEPVEAASYAMGYNLGGYHGVE